MDPILDHQSCESCAKINILQYFQRAIHSRATRFNYVRPDRDALSLGTFESLVQRRLGCCLCRLVVKAICNRRASTKSTPEGIIAASREAQAPFECWLYSYCFADDNPGDVRSTKAFRIGIALQKEERPRLVLDHAGDIQLLAADAKRAGLPELFHGRSVGATIVDMALPRSWIKLCEREHGEPCREPDAETTSSADTAPQDLILIDVRRLCIFYPSHVPRYVALSYCWPTNHVFQLTQDVLGEMLEAGSIERRMTDLPLRIQHAIQITADLGETYLWIDALCIVQDVRDLKQFQILQMNKIYGSAFITIVSAASVRPGDDTEDCDGFPRYRESLKGAEQIIEKVHNMRLAVPFDTIADVLEISRWNSRAWTFEESLLSKRKLFFTEHQIYFQCPCSVFCEDGVGEGSSPNPYIYPGSNLHNMGGINTSKAEIAYYGSLSLKRVPYRTPHEASDDYQTYVGEYTSRHMSDSSDMLNAFYGIQNVLEHLMDTEFLYGLPRKYLDIALLWTLRGPYKRRESSSFADRRFDNLSIPSWTWAGWVGPVELGRYFCITALRSQVIWFLIKHNDYTLLETKNLPSTKEGFDFPQRDNKNVRPQGQPPDTSPLMTKARTGPDYKAPNRIHLQRLACWTTTSFFFLTDNEVPLYNHGLLWQSGTNLAIHDEKSGWVGAMMMDRSWLTENLPRSQKLEFMLLSRSQTLHPINGEPEFFDIKVFEKRPWCLINVMMIQRRDAGVERLGVGFIHEDAWVAANPKAELVTLI